MSESAAPDLAVWLLERLAEDEAWANAAIQTPGATHWHWVNSETDEPVTPDPFTQSALTDEGAVSLRTVEELKPVSWGSGTPLPDFIIWHVDDMLTPGAAGHIARHDPARVLRQVEAHRRIVINAQTSREMVAEQTSVTRRTVAEIVAETHQDALRALASIYSGEPGWREEWAE